VRVPDLHVFRQALRVLGRADLSPDHAPFIVVPTSAAAHVLGATLAALDPAVRPAARPPIVTRDDLYERLRGRLGNPPPWLTVPERDALAQAAAAQAASAVGKLPFSVRPGLVAELLTFYDQLRRQGQSIRRFEELLTEALAGSDDRGAERLLTQTRFLAAAFAEYDRRARATGACDEHILRERLLSGPLARPIAAVIVSVPDWIADPAGLFVADFDLLARLHGLERLDVVCTESVLASGFDERVHNWLPGLDDVDGREIVGGEERVRPQLIRPDLEDERVWFVHRDREEELTAIAGRIKEEALADSERAWDRTAVVFKRPLPYLYLAPLTLGAAGIPFEVADGLPLAAEPVVSAIDLLLDAVETDFSRTSLVTVLGSPHLAVTDAVYTRAHVADMNRFLVEKRFLGGFERLETLVSVALADGREAALALEAALLLARPLVGLKEPAPASRMLRTLLGVLEANLDVRLKPDAQGDEYVASGFSRTSEVSDDDALVARERRALAAMTRVLRNLAEAHAAHHDPVWTLDDLATAVRRWIGGQTFPPEQRHGGGVRLFDDQAARYALADDLTIVGLVEQEWPDKPRRNIFYAPAQLKALGWPSEQDRHAASDARFLDLLASASKRVTLSTFTLDDEALVTRSLQLDEVPRAKLTTVVDRRPTVRGLPSTPARRLSEAEDRLQPGQSAFNWDEETASPAADNAWAVLRASRSPASSPEFHGTTGPRLPKAWSVSALETYLKCPFRFYAQHVLRLEEEPEDEEIMDPRRQGQFVHEVFETFFKEWQNAGHGAITLDTLDLARTRFEQVVERLLTTLNEGEAGLERTRLMGSPVAVGLGDAVFRMEAERAVPVVDRLLEFKLEGRFTIATDAGPREVQIRGKADRLDLLADGTFRLIDYKLGWAPDPGKALQLPMYGIAAEQRLSHHQGRQYVLGEAVYLAFKEPKRVVPLFTKTASRDEVLARASQRVADTIDAIERGEFPPRPDDVWECDRCSFVAVCRKDYVGDV
jgi:ATP-dependent helicase/nuclease subunit B